MTATAQSPWSVTANNKTGSDGFAIPPEENHGAVLVAIVDLGTHEREFDKTDKDGKSTGQKDTRAYRQLFLAWELTDCENPDRKGQNFVLGKEFSLSLGVKSQLRGIVEIWKQRKLADGEGVNDIHLMIGSKFMVDVTHNKSKDGSKTYGNIKAVTSVPKKYKVEEAKLKPFLFVLDGKSKFEPPPWLPQYSYGEKIADKMSASKEAMSFGKGKSTEQQAGETFGGGDSGIPEGEPIAY